MINSTNIPTTTAIALLVAGLATATWAADTATLTYKGNPVSHDVRMIDGKAYVPVADMAKVLCGSVAKASGGYEIQVKAAGAPAGGANEINGLQGKIGQMLFTGKWRFQVNSVTHAPTFSTQYRDTPDTVNPSGANDELIVVNCLIKNAQNSQEQVIMRNYGGAGASVTDDQAVAYPCVYFDYGGGSSYGPTLIPGSAQRFNVVFSVPKGTNLKDLIYSIGAFGENGIESVRISLAQ